jgi:hypothetical protein
MSSPESSGTASTTLTIDRQKPPADKNATQGQECLVKIGSFFVADSKAMKLIQPGKGSLHYPSPATKAAAMLGVTHREKRHGFTVA